MKVFIIALIAISSVLALPEPPRGRYTTLGRQQVPPPASFNPSGWQSQGQRLVFPVRQTAPEPSPSYGPPPQQYGPPQKYGPPTTTEVITTTDVDFTENPNVESFRVTPLKPSRQQQQPENTPVERGQYYILLPDGRLQRVMYVTEADLKNMAYNAKLRFTNVEPITGPIFTPIDNSNSPFVPYYQTQQ